MGGDMGAVRGRHSGFTLIELMMVVAIIGLLAAIVLPKFGNLIVKSKEAAIKGYLGSIRSALSIYYTDNEGILPLNCGQVKSSLVPKYIIDIPFIKIPTIPSFHPYSNSFNDQVNDGDWNLFGNGWAYTLSREIFVNCTHLDSTGRSWSIF